MAIVGDKKICINQSVAVIRPNSKVHPVFLKMLLEADYYQKKMIENAGGSTIKHIYITIVDKMYVALPTNIAEQKAITEVLSDTDNLIQSLEKQIEKKRLIKQGVIQALVSPKEGWKVNKLGELASFYKGKGLLKSDLIADGKYKCIHYGELFTHYKEIIDKVRSRTNCNSNCFLSKANDVLMPTSDVTPNGLATASCINEENVIIGGDVLVIRCNEGAVHGVFLSYSIARNRDQIMQLVSGSTVYHLYGSDMAKYHFSYPGFEEQIKTSTVLREMESEIEILEEKLMKYSFIKTGLMQNLLTGKIRLKLTENGIT